MRYISPAARGRAGAQPLDRELDLGRVIGQRAPGDHSAQLQRVADQAELGQHGDAEPLGHHELAHLRTVGGIGEPRNLVGQQAVHVAVHEIPGAHADERHGPQVGDAHGVPGGQRAVRPHADGRAAAQQRRGLQFRRPVIALQVVDQPEVEAALQDRAVDVGLLRADHLDLGAAVRLPELPDGRREQRWPATCSR
jgi:hypothetical protein